MLILLYLCAAPFFEWNAFCWAGNRLHFLRDFSRQALTDVCARRISVSCVTAKQGWKTITNVAQWPRFSLDFVFYRVFAFLVSERKVFRWGIKFNVEQHKKRWASFPFSLVFFAFHYIRLSDAIEVEFFLALLRVFWTESMVKRSELEKPCDIN